MSMETVDLNELRSQLLSLDANTIIDLYISADFCSFAFYNYICSAVDALVILPLFNDGYLFKFKILSK